MRIRPPKRIINKVGINRWAVSMVTNAVKAGRLTRAYSCEVCGLHRRKIQGHHPNYNYPLQVIWCCVKCHRRLHKTTKVIYIYD